MRNGRDGDLDGKDSEEVDRHFNRPMTEHAAGLPPAVITRWTPPAAAAAANNDVIVTVNQRYIIVARVCTSAYVCRSKKPEVTGR